MAFAAKVKTAAKAVIGAYGASAAAFAAWDYRTMNPTRKYQGWTLDESLVRCRNIMRAPSRKFTPAELEQYNGQGGEASVYFAVRSKGGWCPCAAACSSPHFLFQSTTGCTT